MVEKFFKRLNANEVNASSKYVWPEDYNKLYVFNKRFLANSQLTNFEVIESESIDQKDIVKVRVRLLNAKQELLDYLNSLDVMNSKNEITLDFRIRKANDVEYISIPFDSDSSIIPIDNLKLSSVKTEQLNLRAGPGINFNVVGSLKKYDEILIDNKFNNSDWRKGFIINENSSVQKVYLSSKFTDLNEISFFTIGFFGKFSLITLLIVGIIVCVIVYPMVLIGCFRQIGQAPQFALILLGLIIGSLYFTYQLFENFLFEFFLINIPY
jgi:hypothetical protein